MTDAKQDTNAGLMEAGQFLIDRLKEFESNISDLDDDRAFTGHVLPALARFRAALTGTVQPVAVGVKPRSAEVQEILDNMANVDLEIVEGYIESLEQRLSAVPAPSMKIARTCPNCGVLEGMECKPACPRRIIAEMDALALTQPDAGKEDGW